MSESNKIILLSGGCDPLCVGLIQLMEDASKYGKVVWALNSDNWLMQKKGYVLMKWAERCEILRSIQYVDQVIPVNDEDGSVSSAIELIRPDYFGHGDKEYDVPEKEICEKLGVQMVWNLGGKTKFKSGDVVSCMINNLMGKKK